MMRLHLRLGKLLTILVGLNDVEMCEVREYCNPCHENPITNNVNDKKKTGTMQILVW